MSSAGCARRGPGEFPAGPRPWPRDPHGASVREHPFDVRVIVLCIPVEDVAADPAAVPGLAVPAAAAFVVVAVVGPAVDVVRGAVPVGEEDVVVAVAEEGVGPVAAGERVGAVAAVHQVMPVTAVHPVG